MVSNVDLEFEIYVLIAVPYIHVEEGGNSVAAVYFLNKRQIAAWPIDQDWDDKRWDVFRNN
ncbi:MULTISPECIES: hypothetical protein [unclassified Bradyrhizobium]